MKSLTIRLPDRLLSGLAAESRERNVTVSELVRERIAAYGVKQKSEEGTMELIKDLVGSVKGLPRDMSSKTKHYLRKSGYGKRAR